MNLLLIAIILILAACGPDNTGTNAVRQPLGPAMPSNPIQSVPAQQTTQPEPKESKPQDDDRDQPKKDKENDKC